MTRAASAPCRVRRTRRALAEGTLVAFVAADRADMALAAMRSRVHDNPLLARETEEDR